MMSGCLNTMKNYKINIYYQIMQAALPQDDCDQIYIDIFTHQV